MARRDHTCPLGCDIMFCVQSFASTQQHSSPTAVALGNPEATTVKSHLTSPADDAALNGLGRGNETPLHNRVIV